jgi:hypothetical protein
MIHDESSFDIREANGIKVPACYGSHFKSFDGKARRFLAESNGGPSWFTEYRIQCARRALVAFAGLIHGLYASGRQRRVVARFGNRWDLLFVRITAPGGSRCEYKPQSA